MDARLAFQLGNGLCDGSEQLQVVVVGQGEAAAQAAVSFAQSGFSVVLNAESEDDLAKAQAAARNLIIANLSFSGIERSFILDRIEAQRGELTGVSNAALALAIGQADFSSTSKNLLRLSELTTPQTILGICSTCHAISDLAGSVQYPERVIGMSLFSSTSGNGIVQIARGRRTSHKTIMAGAALSACMGKCPLVVEDVPGFLVDRIIFPCYSEALRLLLEGCQVADVDSALQRFGFRAGPFQLMDQVGLSAIAALGDLLRRNYGTRMEHPDILERLAAHGAAGKAAGVGFYEYRGVKIEPSRATGEIVKALSSQCAFCESSVVDRLVFAMLNEAVRCLDEGVAGRPGPEAASQVNLASVMALGFPAWLGGLIYYAEERGARAIYEKFERLAGEHGGRFLPAEGIGKRAAHGRSFYSAAL